MDGHVSEFWAEILAGRASYPSFEEMLEMRRGHTWPMAERRDLEDESAEREYVSAAQIVATRSLPPEFLAGIDEPGFGAPRRFPFGDRELSANCLVNAITVYGVLEACRRAGVAGRPLRVLEIGAGFGQAARMLIERLDVTTYAVCDLPENLFLSAFYLQALFRERRSTFGGGDGGLVFVTPPDAERLAGPFDLVLNSFSFQEMTRASVNRYFSLARRLLVPDGVLYSLNAHGKDEVRWPSDYPTDGFHLDDIRTPRKYPFQWNATVPYELVLRPGGDAELATTLDAFGCAFQLGLDETVVDGTVSLPDLAGVFRAERLDGKRGRARALRPSPAGTYVEGCLAFASGDRDMSRLLVPALPALGDSLAAVHARMMLGDVAAAAQIAPHLGAQLETVANDPAALAGHLGACLKLKSRTPSLAGLLRRIHP
jgi:putative sugar O-methyltransferase